MGRPGPAEEIAALVAFLLSDRNTYLTGQTIPIDGGFLCNDALPLRASPFAPARAIIKLIFQPTLPGSRPLGIAHQGRGPGR